MSIALTDEFQSFDQRAVIKVCGVGGGGGNAVNRMIGAGMTDVEFIAINTDAQVLRDSKAGTRLQIGSDLTKGLGSGAVPSVGQQAADSDRERIREVVRGADMVFLTVGLGGGTGTGASPVIAEESAACGALTVAVVTLPFGFEGPERMQNAHHGLAALEKHVDTLIVVPNDRVASLSQGNISFLDAFYMADEVLHNGVRAISELITVPGLINLDFADVRTIMQQRGRALMGIGTAEGENRAVVAAEEAIVCPLLEQSNINGAMGVIVNIKGGCDIGMREVQEAVSTVKKAAHPQANIIFGAVIDETQRPELQVTVIAAGFPKVPYERPGSEQPPVRTAAPVEVRPAAAPPRPEAAPAPVAAQAAAPAQPAQTPAATPAAAQGKTSASTEQMLFNDESGANKGRTSAVPAHEPEEDLRIPTFLRRRLSRKKD